MTPPEDLPAPIKAALLDRKALPPFQHLEDADFGRLWLVQTWYGVECDGNVEPDKNDPQALLEWLGVVSEGDLSCLLSIPCQENTPHSPPRASPAMRARFDQLARNFSAFHLAARREALPHLQTYAPDATYADTETLEFSNVSVGERDIIILGRLGNYIADFYVYDGPVPSLWVLG